MTSAAVPVFAPVVSPPFPDHTAPTTISAMKVAKTSAIIFFPFDKPFSSRSPGAGANARPRERKDGPVT